MRFSTGLVCALAATSCLASATARSEPSSARVDVGQGLSIVAPRGWKISHRAFTPCIDPIERFSVHSGRHLLMIQERLNPVHGELSQRPRHFTVHGQPQPMECCSIPGRKGWMLEFGDHARAFYAYVYPGNSSPAPLLHLLDSFRASKRRG
jgi:hypothetical protein